tara:strand:+ start:60 stop:707 length:648 start_codon:yes stop_codon:yes gene_type:complete
MKNNYRILKLRSGEDVITKIVGGDKKSLIIHQPMAMKVASFVSPDGRDRKNVLCMKDWLEYTDKEQIPIPKDWIAVFLKPDEDVIRLYELEKKRISGGPTGGREIAFKEKIEEELAQDKKDSIMDDTPLVDPNAIIATFAIPPRIFLNIIANGLLSKGMEETKSDLFDALFGGMPDDYEYGNHEKLDDEDDDDDEDFKGHGNRWRDWPDNPNEYL